MFNDDRYYVMANRSTKKQLVKKTCRECWTTYEDDEIEVMFTSWSRVDKNSYQHHTCNGCKQKGRDEEKERRRSTAKARNTLYTHADKYIEKGLAESRKDFARKFRWDVQQMAHDIDYAFGNGCPYCRKNFADMANELFNVTLDIINPGDLPYYGINTRWCCATCNREKSKTPPHLWGAKLRAWEKWERQQKRLQIDLYAGSPIFDEIRRQDEIPY